MNIELNMQYRVNGDQQSCKGCVFDGKVGITQFGLCARLQKPIDLIEQCSTGPLVSIFELSQRQRQAVIERGKK